MAPYLRTSAGRDGASWPVLLLLMTVLVPTGGVVWMMRAAMENERLAVRQRLADAYRVQLDGARNRFGEQWANSSTNLTRRRRAASRRRRLPVASKAASPTVSWC